MTRFRCIGPLFGFLTFFFAAASALAQPQSRDKITLDYETILNNKICIVVRLDGTTQARLVLDTGFSTSVLSDSLADALHLTTETLTDRRGRPRMLGGAARVQAAVGTFGVGGWLFRDRRFEIFPAGSLQSIFQGKADGILGQDFFNHYAMYLDPAHKQVTFWEENRFTEGSRIAAGMNEATVLPISLQRGHYNVPVHFGDRLDAEIAIDTGAGRTTLAEEWAAALKLRPLPVGETVVTVEGKSEMKIVRVPVLSFGDITIENVPAHYAPGEPTFSLFPCLGMDVLSHFRMILDVPHHHLYLEPLAAKNR